MSEPRQKFLLIGWDAADWQIISPMMERGEMPHLEQLVDGGVMAHLAAPQPVVSPLLWNSLATGVTPDQHGILGFSQFDAGEGKARPFGSADRKAPAIWDILSKQGHRTSVVNWPASHPAEPLNGTVVSDLFIQSSLTGPSFFEPAPVRPDSTYPPESATDLEPFRIAPGEIDADQIRLFVPRLADVDQTKDPHLQILARCLAESFTTHAVATWLLEHRPSDFMAVCYRGIANCSDAFMRFHPPRLAQISQLEFELYREVVAGVYRLHDLFLGRLLQLAGPNTTVILCSDHGYYSDHLRPPPMGQSGVEAESCHRPAGIFVARGAGFQKDALLHGANVLDITPTILQWHGLPVGRDMGGRPLAEAFIEAQKIQTIASWGELIQRPDSSKTPGGTIRAQTDLKSLPERWDPKHPIAIENQWSLVRVHLGEGHLIQVLPLLEELYEACPLRQDFAITLAESLFRIGLKSEAAQVAETVAAVFPSRPISDLCQVFLDIELRHQPDAALSRLETVEQKGGLSAVLWHYVGLLYLRLSRVAPALAAFNRCLELDPRNALGILGQARCHMHNEEYDRTIASALQAVGLNFSNAEAHFYLGAALAETGQPARALQAFEQCLKFDTMHLPAQRYFMRLGDANPDYKAKAAACRESWQARSATGFSRAQKVQRLRQEFHSRAAERRGLSEDSIKTLNRLYATSDSTRTDTPGKPPSVAFTHRVRPAIPGDIPQLLHMMPAVAQFGAEAALFMIEDTPGHCTGCVAVFAWTAGQDLHFDFLDHQDAGGFILGFVRQFARAHGYLRLVPLRSYAEASPQQHCLEQNGFVVTRELTKLEVETGHLWLDFDRAFQKLHKRGKLPELLRIIPLAEAPYLPVRDLLTSQVGGNALPLDRQLAAGHFCPLTSKVACVGPEVVGVMLASVAGGAADVEFTAVQPGPLRSSLYVVLGRELLAELRAQGVPTLRLSTYNPGIIKSARRAGGRTLGTQLQYALDLQ